MYDLVVVGAGPAGSLAAALGAKAGFSTLILEKKSFPRSKTCGGFVSARALSLLPDDLIFPPESFKPVHKIAVNRGKRSYSHTSEKKLGILVKREQFDHLLVRYACSKGAVLVEGSALNGLKRVEAGNNRPFNDHLQLESAGNKHILARYVIGADGARGSYAALSGLRATGNYRTGWGLAELIETQGGSEDPGTLTFYPLPFLGGMGWSFNGHGWTNRGVGGLAKPHLLLKAYRRLFPEDNENQNPAAWPLPFLGPLKQAASDNLLLIGDAAGLVEPFSGEGLFNSFKSSVLAVQALIRAEEEQRSAGPVYRGLFRAHFQKGFVASLAGATLLHACSIIRPSSLPPLIALLMENNLWSSRGLPDPNF